MTSHAALGELTPTVSLTPLSATFTENAGVLSES